MKSDTIDRKRRQSLKWLLGLSAASQTGFLSAGSNIEIIKKVIPSSGERIPAIGLGTARTFDVSTDSARMDNLAIVMRKFVATGGTLVDSSPMYGNAETVVGELSQRLKLRRVLFYATKVWTSGEKNGIEQMTQSERLLRADRIDLMQIHNLVDWKTQIKTLYRWKARKRIRYIGITHYLNSALDDLMRVIKKENLDFVQLPYSIANREAEKNLLPMMRDKGIAAIINVPFERGELFRKVRGHALPAWAGEFDCGSWAQFFLKFLLSHDAVTCPIPATSKPEHLTDNMRAAFGKLPDNKTRIRMIRYIDAL